MDSGGDIVNFVDALEGSRLPALRIAMRYLMRGSGVYRPDPPILGVRSITVTCLREFGKTLSPRSLKLAFEEKWNNKNGRLDIQRSSPKPLPHMRTDHEFHDWYLSHWMKQADVLSRNDDSTGAYEVLFAGTAGVWSAIFTVGCTSFSNTPVTTPLADGDGDLVE